MNTASRCPICLKSRENCLKQDEQLNTKGITSTKYKRIDKCIAYVLGRNVSFDYRFQGRHMRRFVDIALTLPLCVWEKTLLLFKDNLNDVNKQNIERLVLPNSTKNKLILFFSEKIETFVSGLNLIIQDYYNTLPPFTNLPPVYNTPPPFTNRPQCYNLPKPFPEKLPQL